MLRFGGSRVTGTSSPVAGLVWYNVYRERVSGSIATDTHIRNPLVPSLLLHRSFQPAQVEDMPFLFGYYQ